MGNHNGWFPYDCTDNKSIRVVCEKRASAVADTCTAAAVSFKSSIASRVGWKAYQDRIGCKEKASGARKATRDAAVEAYLKASEGTKAVEADVAKTLAAVTLAAAALDANIPSVPSYRLKSNCGAKRLRLIP